MASFQFFGEKLLRLWIELQVNSALQRKQNGTKTL